MYSTQNSATNTLIPMEMIIILIIKVHRISVMFDSGFYVLCNLTIVTLILICGCMSSIEKHRKLIEKYYQRCNFFLYI